MVRHLARAMGTATVIVVVAVGTGEVVAALSGNRIGGGVVAVILAVALQSVVTYRHGRAGRK